MSYKYSEVNDLKAGMTIAEARKAFAKRDDKYQGEESCTRMASNDFQCEKIGAIGNNKFVYWLGGLGYIYGCSVSPDNKIMKCSVIQT